jgi:hypothetical protein
MFDPFSIFDFAVITMKQVAIIFFIVAAAVVAANADDKPDRAAAPLSAETWKCIAELIGSNPDLNKKVRDCFVKNANGGDNTKIVTCLKAIPEIANCFK